MLAEEVTICKTSSIAMARRTYIYKWGSHGQKTTQLQKNQIERKHLWSLSLRHTHHSSFSCLQKIIGVSLWLLQSPIYGGHNRLLLFSFPSLPTQHKSQGTYLALSFFYRSMFYLFCTHFPLWWSFSIATVILFSWTTTLELIMFAHI